MAKITAAITQRSDTSLLVAASDGVTYIRDSHKFRGKLRHSYSAMPTIVDPARKPADNLDKSIAFVRMPKTVRNIMKGE